MRGGALLTAADAAYGMRSYAVAAARYGEFLSMYRDLPGAARAAMAVGWAALRQGHQDQARRAWTAVADTFPGDARALMAAAVADYTPASKAAQSRSAASSSGVGR